MQNHINEIPLYLKLLNEIVTIHKFIILFCLSLSPYIWMQSMSVLARVQSFRSAADNLWLVAQTHICSALTLLHMQLGCVPWNAESELLLVLQPALPCPFCFDALAWYIKCNFYIPLKLERRALILMPVVCTCSKFVPTLWMSLMMITFHTVFFFEYLYTEVFCNQLWCPCETFVQFNLDITKSSKICNLVCYIEILW